MRTDRATILLVDDEPNILELCRLYLETAQFRVVTAADGAGALEQVRAQRPDLVVLDLMLPDVDGWEVCRRIRADGDLPIIMLTARTEDVDKIIGLELGADDYIAKPFNPRELTARIRAVLRRASAPLEASSPVLACGDVTVDPGRRVAAVDDRDLALRSREFDLLHCLMRHRDLALSRDQLLRQVWGYDFPGETRTVDVHVAALRKALIGSQVEIETVWGVGYRLRGPSTP
jgi:DNA-binding response OmpR family regulator